MKQIDSLQFRNYTEKIEFLLIIYIHIFMIATNEYLLFSLT